MSSEASQLLQPPPGEAAAAESAGVMIRVESLSYDYSGRRALHALSFDVGRGELFGLLGPNGSGKSTLLRILASLRAPGSGRAEVDGQDVASQPAAVRHRLGVAFQSPSLDKKLTVEENIRFQGYLFGLSGKALAARVNEMLKRFGLLERRRERAEIEAPRQHVSVHDRFDGEPLFLCRPGVEHGFFSLGPGHGFPRRRSHGQNFIESFSGLSAHSVRADDIRRQEPDGPLIHFNAS